MFSIACVRTSFTYGFAYFRLLRGQADGPDVRSGRKVDGLGQPDQGEVKVNRLVVKVRVLRDAE